MARSYRGKEVDMVSLAKKNEQTILRRHPSGGIFRCGCGLF